LWLSGSQQEAQLPQNAKMARDTDDDFVDVYVKRPFNDNPP